MKTALFLRFLKSLVVLTAIMDLHVIEGEFVFFVWVQVVSFFPFGEREMRHFFLPVQGLSRLFFCVDASYGLLPLRGAGRFLVAPVVFLRGSKR